MQAEVFCNFIAPEATVLIVDDITSNGKIMEYLLAPLQVQVDLCLSGERAVEMVSEKEYDLVFMDHLMPGIDGIEATSRIRAMGGVYERMAIVALTGSSGSGVREMFISHGMSDFLEKPVDFEKLSAVLDIWIPENKKRRSTAPKQQQAEENACFAIDGIDVELGIHRVGGKVERYIRTLELFCLDGHERIAAIRQSEENHDKRSFLTHVHALKSATANIGAMQLSDLARSLETASMQEDTDYIRENLQGFIEALQQMLQDLADTLAKNKPQQQEPSLNAKDLSGELEALALAIKSFNISETDRLIQHFEKAHLPEPIDPISQCVMLSDYDCAVDLIGQYIRKLNA